MATEELQQVVVGDGPRGPRQRPLAPEASDEMPAYNEGQRAFGGGRLMSSCPYPEGSAERDAWVSGWFDLSHAIGCLQDD